MSQPQRRVYLVAAALVVVAVAFASLSHGVSGKVINFAHVGGVSGDSSLTTCEKNAKLFNRTVQAMEPFDVFFLPNETFWLIGGIQVFHLKHVTFQIDGTFAYTNNQTAWPRHGDGHVYDCMRFNSCHNITFTSSGVGTLYGNGRDWWGAVKYLEIGENRPKLLQIENTSVIVIEHLFFKDSPYYNLWAGDVRDVIIRYCDVVAEFAPNPQRHNVFEIQAFNTDGFDVAGKNVHIHDCNIWNDDDCVAVKALNGDNIQAQCSENYLIERVNASGVGLTIGSVGASDAHTCVRNITFRDSVMHNTFKGIYMKSRPSGTSTSTGEITDVLYHNITIYNPTQWAIWIGPQQAGYGGACSLLWPEDPLSKCPVPENMTWKNITLSDVTVHNPMYSPGVIMGNDTNPMLDVTFSNVKVTNAGSYPWGDKYYYCSNVKNGKATHNTDPIPPCFN
eukprot:m.100842 g.100842  ORF g.100842 m.100842 type:complete len:448 (-) comp12559_c0_seq1:1399-2742(-)